MFKFGFTIVSENWHVASARGNYMLTAMVCLTASLARHHGLCLRPCSYTDERNWSSQRCHRKIFIPSAHKGNKFSVCPCQQKSVVCSVKPVTLFTSSSLPNSKNDGYIARACCKQKIKHCHKGKIKLITPEDLLQLLPFISFCFLKLLLHCIAVLLKLAELTGGIWAQDLQFKIPT